MSAINNAQQQIVSDLMAGFKTHKSQVLAWYTGSGKTNVFLKLCQALIEKNPSVKIGISSYLHMNIKHQTSVRASTILESHSVINACDTRYRDYEDENVYIFNPQTLYRRNDLPFRFDYLIIDEAHIGLKVGQGNSYFEKIITDHCSPNVKILAASATSWDILKNPLLENPKIHTRGMDIGVHEDGMLTDFDIHIERVELKTTKADFSRRGDLRSDFVQNNFELLKKVTVGKANLLIQKFPKRIGSKCLIIVPPGDQCGIAKAVAKSIGDEAVYLIGGNQTSGRDYRKEEEKGIIEDFRNNPERKYLVVVNKCQIGFDMPELTSTIDLTMTRNVGLLIQRWGRLARKQRGVTQKKHFFYAIDQSMLPEEAEWMLGTSIEFAMCKWDSAPANLRNRATRVFDLSAGAGEFSTNLSTLIRKYSGVDHESHRTVTFSEETAKPGTWNRELLIEEARKYVSRTELSENNRYVYNMLKKHFNDDLDDVFPRKNKAWTKQSAIAAVKTCTTRLEFKRKFAGAAEFLEKNGLIEEMNKRLPRAVREPWTVEEALEAARQYSQITKFRESYRAAYDLLRQEAEKQLYQVFNKRHQFKVGRKSA